MPLSAIREQPKVSSDTSVGVWRPVRVARGLQDLRLASGRAARQINLGADAGTTAAPLPLAAGGMVQNASACSAVALPWAGRDLCSIVALMLPLRPCQTRLRLRDRRCHFLVVSAVNSSSAVRGRSEAGARRAASLGAQALSGAR